MARKKADNQKSTEVRTSVSCEIVALDDTITRANSLIEGMFSSTLLENKLTVWALKNASASEEGLPVATMTASEIRKLTGLKGNSLYHALKIASKHLVLRHVFWEDPHKHEFSYFNLIDTAEYREGVFTVTFTSATKNRIWALKSNYTSISLQTLLNFKSNYSFRLFEILKVEEWRIRSDNAPIVIEYNFSELKMKMNLVDMNDDAVVKLLDRPGPDGVDYDTLLQAAPSNKRKYDEWYEFKRNVLDVAQEEIHEKTELRFEFEPVRSGKGGKVTAVIFRLSRAVIQMVEDPFLSEDSLVTNVLEMVAGSNLTKMDAVSLLKAADGDIEKIRWAWNKAKVQTEIRNLVGWMITCIKEGYQEPVAVIEGDSERYKAADQLVQAQHKYKSEHQEELVLETWKRMRQSDRFAEFEAYIYQSTGLELYFWESLYLPLEKIKVFRDWLQQKNK